MNLHRYRRLHTALSLSVFVGYLTSRHSGTVLSGLIAFAAVLIFSSLVLFVVSSSSTIHESVAANLSFFTGLIFMPVLNHRTVSRDLDVRLPAAVLTLPFRFQLPPPTSSL
jgi:hypothetical protein